MVQKLQTESEQLRAETFVLQREKKELIEFVQEEVRSVRSVRDVLKEKVREAVAKRDEVWKEKLGLLREGIVEGVRGAFGEVVEEMVGVVGVEGVEVVNGVDSAVGMMEGVEGMEGMEGMKGRTSGKRKRRDGDGDGHEDHDEALVVEHGDGVDEDMRDGDGESVDLGTEESGAAGGSGCTGGVSGSYDDGLEDMERRIMRMRERVMRKRRRWSPEEDTDPDL